MAKDKLVKRVGVRVAVVVLVLMMLIGGVLSGTYAWLIASSNQVKNTFTYGDINITLEETDTGLDGDGQPTTNDYKMVPGASIDKDPTVSVLAGSEACWLFVKLEKSDNFDDFLEFELAVDAQGNPLWTELEGVEGVYFRQVTAQEVLGNDAAFAVLKDNRVLVKGSVTKEQLNALDPEGGEADYPTLTVSAYAVQYFGFEPRDDEGYITDVPTDTQRQGAAAAAWAQAVIPTP